MTYGCRSYFESEWLDRALMVGMTPEQFWYGDPELFYNYSRVFEQKYKYEQKNFWQIGARFCQALQSTPVAPLGLLDGKDLQKLPSYPPCPFEEEQEQGNKEELTAAQKKTLKNRFIERLKQIVPNYEDNSEKDE